jgi:hypothetical protein
MVRLRAISGWTFQVPGRELCIGAIRKAAGLAGLTARSYRNEKAGTLTEVAAGGRAGPERERVGLLLLYEFETELIAVAPHHTASARSALLLMVLGEQQGEPVGKLIGIVDGNPGARFGYVSQVAKPWRQPVAGIDPGGILQRLPGMSAVFGGHDNLGYNQR